MRCKAALQRQGLLLGKSCAFATGGMMSNLRTEPETEAPEPEPEPEPVTPVLSSDVQPVEKVGLGYLAFQGRKGSMMQPNE